MQLKSYWYIVFLSGTDFNFESLMTYLFFFVLFESTPKNARKRKRVKFRLRIKIHEIKIKSA